MRFEKGHTGRPKGTRNKLTARFLEDFLCDWEANGAAAIRIVRIEHPEIYVRIAAQIIPRDLHLETSASLADLADDELDEMIGQLRQRSYAGNWVMTG